MGQIFVWTLSDVIYVAVGTLLFGAWGIVSAVTWWQQMRCKHDGQVNETRACEAICRKCGKNLGFIGNWRKSHVD